MTALAADFTPQTPKSRLRKLLASRWTRRVAVVVALAVGQYLAAWAYWTVHFWWMRHLDQQRALDYLVSVLKAQGVIPH